MLRNVPNSYNDQNFGMFETHFLIGETSERQFNIQKPTKASCLQYTGQIHCRSKIWEKPTKASCLQYTQSITFAVHSYHCIESLSTGWASKRASKLQDGNPSWWDMRRRCITAWKVYTHSHRKPTEMYKNIPAKLREFWPIFAENGKSAGLSFLGIIIAGKIKRDFFLHNSVIKKQKAYARAVF